MNRYRNNPIPLPGTPRLASPLAGGLIALLVLALAALPLGCGDDDDGAGGNPAGGDGSSCAADRDCGEGLFCDLSGRAIVAKNAETCLFDCVFDCDFGDEACEEACIARCVPTEDCPAFCDDECLGDPTCTAECLQVCSAELGDMTEPSDVPSDFPSDFPGVPPGLPDPPPGGTPGGGGTGDGGAGTNPPAPAPAGVCRPRATPQPQPSAPGPTPAPAPVSSEAPAPPTINWVGTWTITPNYTHDCNSRVRDFTQPSTWRFTGSNADLTATYSQNNNYTMAGSGSATRLQLNGQWFATDHNNTASSPNSSRNNVSITVENIIDENTAEGTISGTYDTSAAVTCRIQDGGRVRLTR